jgi:hypothetical protein
LSWKINQVQRHVATSTPTVVARGKETLLVKSAQASDMPAHQGKMDAERATAMWSNAGVGVAAQLITSQ